MRSYVFNYETRQDVFPCPRHHKIELSKVADVFPCSQAASRYAAVDVDVDVTDEQWRMMMEMRVSGAAFLSRYDDSTGKHDGPMQFLLNANDVFYWACSDDEPFSFDQVDEVYAIWKDSGGDGLVRWMCEKRGMRPHVPLIEHMRARQFNMDWIENLAEP